MYTNHCDINLYNMLRKAISKNDFVALKKSLRHAGYLQVKNYRDNHRCGDTLLHMAVEQGSVKMTDSLIAVGCEVNARRTSDGCTPLMRASDIENEETRVKIVRLLLEAGADAGARAEDRPGLAFFLDRNCRRSAALMIQRGASVNESITGRMTLLNKAAAEHKEANVLFLLDHGAKPTASSLEFAIRSLRGVSRKSRAKYDHVPSANVLRALLEAGADPNVKLIQDRPGFTVFHKILERASMDVVRMFVRHGASVGTLKKGKKLRDQAAKNKDRYVLKLITALQSGKIDYKKV